MKKMLKMMVVMMMVIAAVLTAGCGEEEKYNKLKTEIIQYAEETQKSAPSYYKPLSWSKVDPVNLRNVEAHIKYLESRIPEYNKKIAEIEKIAAKKVELNNDFQKWRPQTDRMLIGNLEKSIRDKEELSKPPKENKYKNWNGAF